MTNNVNIDDLYVFASKASKIKLKEGSGHLSFSDLFNEIDKIPEDQIKYFLLQDYYFAAPYGFD